MTIQGLPPFNPKAADHPAETDDPSDVNEVGPTTLGEFALVTEESRWQIVQQLDINDLLSLSCCSSYWNNLCKDDRLWLVIAGKIGSVLFKGFPYKDQVRLFTQDCVETTNALGGIFKKQFLTSRHVGIARAHLMVRSIEKVWFRLGKALNPEANEETIFGERLSTLLPGQRLAKARSFHTWFLAHQNELAALERLDLSNGNLSFLPPELCSLSNLKVLNLSKNHLRYFPAQICSLTQLTDLLLTDNPLRDTVTQQPLNLPPNLNITPQFLQSLPIELNLQIAAQIGLDVDLMRENGWRTENVLAGLVDGLMDVKLLVAFLVEFTTSGRNVTPQELHTFFSKHELTINEFRTLLAWRTARETLKLWRLLEEKLNSGPVKERNLNTIEDYIRETFKFGKWLVTNQEALAKLPESFITLSWHTNIKELINHPILGRLINIEDSLLQQKLMFSQKIPESFALQGKLSDEDVEFILRKVALYKEGSNSIHD